MTYRPEFLDGNELAESRYQDQQDHAEAVFSAHEEQAKAKVIDRMLDRGHSDNRPRAIGQNNKALALLNDAWGEIGQNEFAELSDYVSEGQAKQAGELLIRCVRQYVEQADGFEDAVASEVWAMERAS